MLINRKIAFSKDCGKYCVKISAVLEKDVEHTLLEFLAVDKYEAFQFMDKLKKDVGDLFDESLYEKVTLN